MIDAEMPMMMGEMIVELKDSFITPAENKRNTKNALDNWMLGPEKPSLNYSENKDYYKKLAKAWGVEEKEARRKMCGNCEYFKNCPKTQVKMEKIPLTDLDENAGARGYCTKLEFICHGMRVCQGWDD